MTRYLFVALLAGCNGDETADEPDPTPTQAQPQAPAQEEPGPEDRLQEALELADAGRHAEALTALEALLGEHPDLEGIWGYVEQEALATGDPAAFLDRLSVTDAIGGETARHHALRATLALAADRPVDAMDAANALAPVDPEAARGFRILAIEAGAHVDPETLDPDQPHEALTLALLESDPERKRELLEASKDLEGWRVRMARARQYLELGDPEAARAELDRIGGEISPRTRLAVLPLRLKLVEDPGEAADLLLEGATLARERHASGQASAWVLEAVERYLRIGDAEQALEAARRHHEGYEENAGTPDAVRVAVAFSRAAWSAGEIDDAVEALHLEAGELGEAHVDVQNALGRMQARAGFATCDGDLLDAAAGHLPAFEAAIQGLAARCEGDVGRARELLDSTGLPPSLGYVVATAASEAHAGTAESVEWARRAVTHADEMGYAPVRLDARLRLERAARLQKDHATRRAALAELTTLADTPALQAERFARALAGGDEPGSFPAYSDGEPPELGAWRAFTEAYAPSGDATPKGMAAWAQARVYLEAGDDVRALEAFGRVLPDLPVRRQGHWAPALTLLGGDGVAMGSDLHQAGSLVRAGAGGESLFALQEWARFLALQRMAVRVGDDLTMGIPEEERLAFRTAMVRERSRSLRWLLGEGDFPRETVDAVRETFASHDCLGGLDMPPGFAELREIFPETVFFSIHLEHRRGDLLVVSPLKVERFPLEEADEIRALVKSYRSALLSGQAFSGERTDPTAGDRIRRLVLDPARGHLSGIARYFFLLDPDLLTVSWFTLPEQSQGRRYLADIRTVSASVVTGPLLDDPEVPENGYTPDFFGIGRIRYDDEADAPRSIEPDDEVSRTMEAAGLKNPGELTSIARLFGGGFSETFVGEEALEEHWWTYAPKARYVHVAGMPAAANGGFLWADGVTALSEIRCGNLTAPMVVVSGAAAPEVQVVRAHALLEAGAGSAVVAMWDILPSVNTRYLNAFYDAINRDRAPARALGEARELLGKDATRNNERFGDPSFWGHLMLVGAP